MREEHTHWPKYLLWHGWLPMLSVVNGASPSAADASESAVYLVEVALGRYSSSLVAEWSLPDGFDADEVSARMPDAPEVWSDGSLVLDSVTVSLLLVLGCLLTSLNTAGGAVGGAMLIVYCWIECLILATVLCLYLGFYRLYRELSCGRSFLLFSLLMPFMWELTILVLFGMLGA